MTNRNLKRHPGPVQTNHTCIQGWENHSEGSRDEEEKPGESSLVFDGQRQAKKTTVGAAEDVRKECK